jgi:hypothetical protein
MGLCGSHIIVAKEPGELADGRDAGANGCSRLFPDA